MPSYGRVAAFVLVALLFAACGAPEAPAPPPADEGPRRLVLGDYVGLTRIGDVEISPLGDRLVYERSGIDVETDRWTTSIWSAALEGGRPAAEPVPLAAGEGSFRHPRFSPDGRRLAYLHSRDGDPQVWVAPVDGPAWQLTDLPEGVDDFGWSPGSDRIVLVSHDPPADAPTLVPEEERQPDQPGDVLRPQRVAGDGTAGRGVEAASSSIGIDDRRQRNERDQDDDSTTTAYGAAGGAGKASDDGKTSDGGSGEDQPLPWVITRLNFKVDGTGYVGLRRDHLYVVDVPEARPAEPLPARQITDGPWDDGSPAWSPDGNWIAFVSKRVPDAEISSNSDIWLVAPDGGEPLRITTDPGEDTAPAWSPDGGWVAFLRVDAEEPIYETSTVWLAAVVPAVEEGSVEASAVEAAGAARAAGFQERALPLTAAIDRFAWQPPRWSADGSAVFAIIEDRGATPVVRLEVGAARQALTTSPTATASADSQLVGAAVGDPRAVNGASASRGPAIERLSTNGGVTFVGPRFGGAGAGASVATAAVPAAALAGLDVPVATVLSGPHDVTELAVAPDGATLAVVMSGGVSAEEVWIVPAAARPDPPVPLPGPEAFLEPALAPAADELVRVTAENLDWTRPLVLSEPRPIRFDSRDGTPIEGWVVLPYGYEAGRRYPTLLRIHGGPVGQYSWAFDFELQWYAARGYAVVYTNPRGSTGYGEAFARAIYQDWGNLDLEDVVAGVDHLIAEGIADPERLGVGGWSYGGILTNWAITKTGRFAAAVSGAAEADNLSSYGTDDIQWWWEHELGLPWQERELYDRLSPIHDVARVTTPTLFIVGAEDWRQPLSNVEELYTRLRRRMIDGGPATGLIVYPGESHGISRPSFLIDRMRRNVAWYDRFLRGNETADPFFGERAW